MKSRKAAVVAAMAISAAISLQGTAGAVLPSWPAQPDGHAAVDMGKWPSKTTFGYSAKRAKFKGAVSTDFVAPKGMFETDTEFDEVVESDAAKVCVQNRKVNVYKVKRDGTTTKLNDSPIKTNALGQWSFGWSNQRGKYKAEVVADKVLIREYYGSGASFADYYGTCQATSSTFKFS